MNPDFHFLRLSSGRFRVNCRHGDRFCRPVCVRVRPFWNRKCYGLGCAVICHDGRTQLKIGQGPLSAVRYKHNILDPIVLPFLQQRNGDHVFQHDNARCHVARVWQDFLNQNHIRVRPCKGYLPSIVNICNGR